MRKTAKKIQQSLAGFIDPCEEYPLFTLRHAPEMSSVIYEVKKALKKGIEPERIDDDPYPHVFLLKDSDGDPLAIFKTTRFLREYTAYRLDHDRFANVPPTVLTSIEHAMWGGKRKGSLQLFIDETRAVKTMQQEEIHTISAESIRCLASLDIRLLNHGRHRENILEKNGQAIPIDHEYILLASPNIKYFCWMNWKQTKTHFSKQECTYFSMLDPEVDRKILIEEIGFNEAIANHYYLATFFLKIAVLKNLTIFDLGSFFKSKKKGEITIFEKLLESLEPLLVSSTLLTAPLITREIERIIDAFYS